MAAIATHGQVPHVICNVIRIHVDWFAERDGKAERDSSIVLLHHGRVANGNRRVVVGAGDVNGDGLINETDVSAWSANAGKKGYQSSDLNLDNQVNNQDKNDNLVENTAMSDQVPD